MEEWLGQCDGSRDCLWDGINRPNTHHIVRCGVSESLCSWAQEFGYGGRNGAGATMQSMARLTMQRPGVGNMKGQIRHIENKYSVSSQDLGSL